MHRNDSRTLASILVAFLCGTMYSITPSCGQDWIRNKYPLYSAEGDQRLNGLLHSPAECDGFLWATSGPVTNSQLVSLRGNAILTVPLGYDMVQTPYVRKLANGKYSLWATVRIDGVNTLKRWMSSDASNWMEVPECSIRNVRGASIYIDSLGYVMHEAGGGIRRWFSSDGNTWTLDKQVVTPSDSIWSIHYTEVFKDDGQFRLLYGGHVTGTPRFELFSATSDSPRGTWTSNNVTPYFPVSSDPSAFDSRYTSKPCIVQKSDRIEMLYSARSMRNNGDGGYFSIGIATKFKPMNAPILRIEGTMAKWTEANGCAAYEVRVSRGATIILNRPIFWGREIDLSAYSPCKIKVRGINGYTQSPWSNVGSLTLVGN